MASNSVTSDSDEYEIMTPMKAAELLKAMEKGKMSQQSSNKKEKKKKIFRRFSKNDPKKDLAVVITSPTTALPQKNPSKAVAKSVPVQRSHSQNSPAAILPRTGPKPPKVLSTEEKMQQKRKQHKEHVELARKERIRKASEPSSEQQQRSQSIEYEPEYTIDRSYGELEVGDFVNKYSNHLPLEVVVTKGIYGMEDQYSLATADRCILHFIKRRELILIHDPKTNKEFSVPINSAIKFAVVYNPNDNENEAMVGITYPLVSDILGEARMPKIGIAYLKDPDIVGMKSLEAIVIKEVIFPQNPIDPRKLRVYSLTAKCEHILEETEDIHFKTCPSLMQFYLPDLLKHVPNPCPLHVAMYRNPLARPLIAPGIPSSMFRHMLYLKKRYTDILVVATGSSEGATSDDNFDDQPFEIPTDIDVEFEVIKHSEMEKEKMLEQSRRIKEKFADKDIRHHRYVGMSDEEHRMQLSIFKSTLSGGGLEGISGGEIAAEEAVDGDYVKATSGNRLAMNHRVELLEENMKRCSQTLSQVMTTIDSLTEDNKSLTEKVKNLNDIVSVQYCKIEEVNSVEKQMDTLFTEIETLKRALSASQALGNSHTLGDMQGHTLGDTNSPKEKGRVTSSSSSSSLGSKLEDTPEVYERNKKLLSSMAPSEVQVMLKLAGLHMYADTFTAESVSGDILIECDGKILETELGIKSKLHRLKLMRIINGKGPEEVYKLVD